MEWQDEGVVLRSHKHGETAAVVSCMTFEHGRHLGLVRGGTGRNQRPLLQPGNRLQVTWRARLPEHLGAFTLEPVSLYAARMLADPLKLTGMSAACALLDGGLAERDSHPALYAAMVRMLEHMRGTEAWLADYVRFELLLLAELGFGLDLAKCAVTGSEDDLVWVSPRTGRAVSREAGSAYAPKLLPLPPFLRSGAGDPPRSEIREGLRLSGYFLARHLFEPADRGLPDARDRLLAKLNQPEETAPDGPGHV